MSLPSYWKINCNNTVNLYKTDPIYENPVLDIFVSDTFNFIIRVFAWCLPTDHEIYKNYNSSVKNITVSNSVKVFSNFRVCEGTKNRQVLSYCNQHVVLKKFDPFMNNGKSSENKFYRSPLCILLSSNETCTKYLNFESNKVTQIKKMAIKQSATNLIPAKSKAPISKLSNERVKVTFQHYRIENKALKSKIDELQLELERSSMKVSAELSEDLVSIVSKTDQCTVSPFTKFFWEEQQKYLKSS